MNKKNLYLVRHGQSIYNLENRFTGWRDVELTDLGKSQAKEAGDLLANVVFDYCYISKLKRAKNTLEIILDQISQKPPIESNQALNERDYGDLIGQNKEEASNLNITDSNGWTLSTKIKTCPSPTKVVLVQFNPNSAN